MGVFAIKVEYEIDEKQLASPGKYRKLSEARGLASWLILDTGNGTIADRIENALIQARPQGLRQKQPLKKGRMR
jgi:hypothetical protein